MGRLCGGWVERRLISLRGRFNPAPPRHRYVYLAYWAFLQTAWLTSPCGGGHRHGGYDARQFAGLAQRQSIGLPNRGYGFDSRAWLHCGYWYIRCSSMPRPSGNRRAKGGVLKRMQEYAHVIFAAPVPGVCPICAIRHAADQPHNCESAYYRMRFRRRYGRGVTWQDACAHCADKVRETERRKHGSLD